MKKTLALLMALLVLLGLSAPLYAVAEANIDPAPDAAPAVTVEATEAPAIDDADGGDHEADPGGEFINLTDIIQAVFAVLLAIFMKYLAPWIKARTTQWQRDMLIQITATLVNAAEQKFGSGTGKDKMNYVIGKLQDRGYTVDEDMIEALVRTLPENVRPKSTKTAKAVKPTE